MASSTLNEVIASFDSWSQPWTFSAHVEERISSSHDMALFNEALAVANDKALWLAASDIAEGSKSAEAALQRFGGLDSAARKALARAAAYQWK